MDTFENLITSKINSFEKSLKIDFDYLSTFAQTRNCNAALEKSRNIAETQIYLEVYKELLSLYRNTR